MLRHLCVQLVQHPDTTFSECYSNILSSEWETTVKRSFLFLARGTRSIYMLYSVTGIRSDAGYVAGVLPNGRL
jgi:hypothetical protein